MTDLVEFLRARLDEDEQTARAASPGPWRAEPCVYGPPEAGWGKPTDWEVHAPDGRVVSHQPYEGGGADEPDAIHIARHDPARVLREVQAKRRIIDEVWRELDEIDPGVYWGEAPALLLRLLALPYADHPDYREEWRP